MFCSVLLGFALAVPSVSCRHLFLDPCLFVSLFPSVLCVLSVQLRLSISIHILVDMYRYRFLPVITWLVTDVALLTVFPSELLCRSCIFCRGETAAQRFPVRARVLMVCFFQRGSTPV
ncbi:unnamed protein product [Sphacelaria rigidula]